MTNLGHKYDGHFIVFGTRICCSDAKWKPSNAEANS